MQKVTAKQVVDGSLAALRKGKSSTIPGWINRVAMAVALRALPRELNASIAGWLLERAHR